MATRLKLKVGVLDCGDTFRTGATRRWGKCYGTVPGTGTAVKIAEKLADVPAAPLRWIHPDVFVEPVGN